MVGRYLIKCLATLLTAPTVSSDTMRPQVNVNTMPRLEFLPTLFTTKWTLLGMFEQHMELHVSLPIELPGTVRTVVVGSLTFPPLPILCMAHHMIQQLGVVSKVPAAAVTHMNLVRMKSLHMLGKVLPLLAHIGAVRDPAVVPDGLTVRVDCLPVSPELLVGDEVDVTLGTPVLSILRRHVCLPDVSLPVP